MILEFVIIRLIVLIRGNILAKVPHRKEGIPTKTRSRSVPDVTDTKFSARHRTAH